VDALHLGAMIAAVKSTVRLKAMAYDSHATMGAGGGQQMDCAFETVKDVALVLDNHLKRLVVFVTTMLTAGHWLSPFGSRSVPAGAGSGSASVDDADAHYEVNRGS
jgi:hypothetical protein